MPIPRLSALSLSLSLVAHTRTDTYLDGELHVKLALAADAVIAGVRKEYPETACAFLCTPTDIHVIPSDAHDAAIDALAAIFSEHAPVLTGEDEDED